MSVNSPQPRFTPLAISEGAPPGWFEYLLERGYLRSGLEVPGHAILSGARIGVRSAKATYRRSLHVHPEPNSHRRGRGHHRRLRAVHRDGTGDDRGGCGRVRARDDIRRINGAATVDHLDTMQGNALGDAVGVPADETGHPRAVTEFVIGVRKSAPRGLDATLEVDMVVIEPAAQDVDGHPRPRAVRIVGVVVRQAALVDGIEVPRGYLERELETR